MKLTLRAAVVAGTMACALINAVTMCGAALAGRWPAVAFYVLATLGSCSWVGAAWDRWRTAVAEYVDVEPERERL